MKKNRAYIELSSNGKKIAIVDSIHNFRYGLNFYGNTLDDIQVGAFHYDKNHMMKAHKHIVRERKIKKTQECMIVFQGAVLAVIYDEEEKIIAKRVLKDGDFLILLNGGVGYKVLDNDTKMLEVKAGNFDVLNDDEDRELINNGKIPELERN